MALFDRPTTDTKVLLNKTQQSVKRSSIKGDFQSKLNLAKSKLSHHKDDYILIRDIEALKAYCSKIEQYGEGAIDTETTGLNPLLVDLVGICLYCPNEKACYIPINHKSYITNEKISNQLTYEEVAPIIKSVKCKWIMHNGKYDIRVLRHTLNIDLDCYWDTFIAANCIDENESHKLKDLHFKYCNSKDEESLTFSTLFDGISFDLVPIDIAYLYAAGDAIKTYELYNYQKTVLNRRNLSGPYNVFMNIEMPILKICADMEDRGVAIDFEKAKYLKEKYTEMREGRSDEAKFVLEKYNDKIQLYLTSHPKCKLSNPINLASPTQLAILFYDILGLTSPDRKNKRATGAEVLYHWINNDIEKELCQSILDVREVEKLLSTYIEKVPEVAINGRVHCSFNSYGAKTSRMSSSDFNLQNIPTNDHDIRQMFKAQDGYCFVGGDYSGQEVRIVADLSNDKQMIQAYNEGKDIYCAIASLAFNVPYEECKEFRDDGTVNKDGKERRSQAKKLTLGVLYGRGIPSIAEQLNTSIQKAQEIYDSVMRAFPELKNFILQSEEMAKELGYVTTKWGTRRHLPDIQLDEYVCDCGDDKLSNYYIQRLKNCKTKSDKDKIKRDAKLIGITITDNGGKIAQAQRQCVNARVQGSAANLTKLAMINVANDKRMKELDCHIILQIHDEIQVECPIENAKEVKERLEYLMLDAHKELLKVPLSVDCEITKCWYGEKVEL